MVRKLIAALAAVFAVSAASASIELTPQNMVLIRGEIDYGSVGEASRKLVDLHIQRGDKDYPIYLVLDSPGGSIMAGEDFISFASAIPNLHTVTIFAASMASAIVQALPGKRCMVSHGIQMYHRASMGIEGQIEEGEVESRLNMMKKYVRRMEQRSALRIGISLESYKSKVKDEWWLTAEESKAANAADQIVSLKCSEELMAKDRIIAIQILMFNFKLKVSECPLIPGAVPVSPEDEEAQQKAKQLLKQLKELKNGQDKAS